MKQVRFTARELDVIISMVAIAGANPPEGDYQDWTDKDYKAADSVFHKAHELLRRKKKLRRDGRAVDYTGLENQQT